MPLRGPPKSKLGSRAASASKLVSKPREHSWPLAACFASGEAPWSLSGLLSWPLVGRFAL